MSRLTFRDSKGELWIKDAADIDEQGQICMLTERLAAYEDTGLEPEVCANYKAFEDEAISKGITFNRIVELMEADKDGLCVVLPCKVGDAVYKIAQGMSIYKSGLTPYIAEITPKSLSQICQWVEEGYYLGKTVFLTREEAEAALEKEGTNGQTYF